MYDTGLLSAAGTIGGIALKLGTGKKWLQWMQPVDDSAVAYKAAEVNKVADVDKLIKIQEIDTQLSLGGKNLSRGMEAKLIAERERLVQSLENVDDLDYPIYFTEGQFTIEPFTERFDNELTGWVFPVGVVVPNNFDSCNIPATSEGSGE